MTKQLYSTGQIADLLGTKRDYVQYHIRQLHIKPAAVIGASYGYDQAAVEKIREAICKTAERRAGKGV